MSSLKRLFVPLATKPYKWFSCGKKWELRKYGRQYTEKYVAINRIVEFRMGYNNRDRAIWGAISEVIVKSLQQVFDEINYQEITPECSSKDEAMAVVKGLMNIEDKTKCIAFKVQIIEKKQFIKIDDYFYGQVIEGKKITTIRRGKREYDKGLGVLFFSENAVLIDIKEIKFVSIDKINESDAKKDGFDKIEDLKKVLNDFYKDIRYDEIMTIIEFKILK